MRELNLTDLYAQEATPLRKRRRFDKNRLRRVARKVIFAG